MTQLGNIQTILHWHRNFSWSVQGFGMFRCYLTDSVRLHVWDDRVRVQGVSDIHTHPWDFSSEIISGRVRNVIYKSDLDEDGFMAQLIQPGENGGPLEAAVPCGLEITSDCTYEAGDTYGQKADEIHCSNPSNGTVTLCTRSNRRLRDVAYSFYPAGGSWIDAEPREPTGREVRDACELALARWCR